MSPMKWDSTPMVGIHMARSQANDRPRASPSQPAGYRLGDCGDGNRRSSVGMIRFVSQ